MSYVNKYEDLSGDKIVKRRLQVDTIDVNSIHNEYDTHAYVWKHAPLYATYPYPPFKVTTVSGDTYVYLAQDCAPGVEFTDLAPVEDWVYEALGHALACLHKLGVLHNDLHGSNIIVDTKTKRVTLIDWGESTRGCGVPTLNMETRLFEGNAPLLADPKHHKLVEEAMQQQSCAAAVACEASVTPPAKRQRTAH